jgi:phosphoglycolate phosphatase
MKKPVVMLDHDGVLVDSLAAFCRVFLRAAHAHGHPEFSTQQQVVDLFKGNVYQSLLDRGLRPDEVRTIVGETSEGLARATDVKPVPGVGQFLADLAERFDLVVVTSNRGDLVRHFYEREGLSVHVASVLGSESGTSKVAKIATVIAGHPGQHSYPYVGDTCGDMIESANAGATPIGVAWGWHEPGALRDAGAVHVSAEPAGLGAYLAGSGLTDS